MPIRLPATYGSVYRRMLKQIGSRWPTQHTSLTAFWPMVGHSFAGGVLVIGRAVNGWSDSVLESLLDTDDGVEHVARRARCESEGTGRCPMLWVSDCATPKSTYNTRRSAFWRVTRGVVDRLGVADTDAADWPCHIAWSNLYKIAPHDGGNPSDAACEAQWPDVAELVAAEVAALAPQRVLVLAGRAWAEDFDDELGLGVSWRRGSRRARTPIAGVADALGARWVIAAHPQGKKEQTIVDEVVRAFEDR